MYCAGRGFLLIPSHSERVYDDMSFMGWVVHGGGVSLTRLQRTCTSQGAFDANTSLNAEDRSAIPSQPPNIRHACMHSGHR